MKGVRGGKTVPLKANVDEALTGCPNVKSTLVIKRTATNIKWYPNRDVWYEDLVKDASSECEPEPMNSEDPLFILYTSGSTGKAKGCTSFNCRIFAGSSCKF